MHPPPPLDHTDQDIPLDSLPCADDEQCEVPPVKAGPGEQTGPASEPALPPSSSEPAAPVVPPPPAPPVPAVESRTPVPVRPPVLVRPPEPLAPP
jgi:hypothetical protein